MSSSTRFKISLRIVHPRLRSEAVTDALGLLPWFSYSAGDEKVTPKGNAIGGLRAETYWTHEWPSLDSLGESLDQLTQHLLVRGECLRQLTGTGGRVECFIGWFSSENSGFYVTSALSGLLGELGIDLAFDIHPEVAAHEQAFLSRANEMSGDGVVELEAEAVTFYSHHDERCFFEWLQSMACVKRFEGRGRIVSIFVDKALLSRSEFLDLIGFFYRYGIAMAQLRQLESAESSGWLRSVDSYWYSRVFGS